MDLCLLLMMIEKLKWHCDWENKSVYLWCWLCWCNMQVWDSLVLGKLPSCCWLVVKELVLECPILKACTTWGSHLEKLFTSCRLNASCDSNFWHMPPLLPTMMAAFHGRITNNSPLIDLQYYPHVHMNECRMNRLGAQVQKKCTAKVFNHNNDDERTMNKHVQICL